MSEPTMSNSVAELANRYAAEIQAQFRTLNLFVGNPTEIGRAHEALLAGVLRRFLPRSISIDTGFVAFPTGEVSPQVDVLIHNDHDHPPLFHAGTCAVVSHEAVLATVETKTTLSSVAEFMAAYEKESGYPSPWLNVIYAWDGITLDTARDAITAWISEEPVERAKNLIDVIVVRGRFMLLANHDGRFDSPPYRFYDFSSREDGDGLSLLILANLIYSGAAMRLRTPWWLDLPYPWETDGYFEYDAATQAAVEAEHQRRLEASRPRQTE